MMFNNKERINSDIFHITNDSYSIDLKQNSQLRNIVIPNVDDTEAIIQADVYVTRNSNKTYLTINPLLPYIQDPHMYDIEIPLQDPDPAFISLNQVAFIIPTLQDQISSYLGEITLNAKKPNTLILYKTSPVRLPSKEIINIQPYLCSSWKENQIFGGETTLNGFQIYGQNAQICAQISLSQLVPTVPSFIRLHFEYSSNAPKADICIMKSESNECINQTILSSDSSTAEIILSNDGIMSNNKYMKIILHTTENKLQTFSVQNITYDYYQPQQIVEFPLVIAPFKIAVDDTTIRGLFSQKQQSIDITDFASEMEDCGYKKARYINSEKTTWNNVPAIVTTAQDGYLCQRYEFPSLSHATGYIVGVESQNISGPSTKICFEDNITKNCLLEEFLTGGNMTHYDYFIVPPYANAYGFNLITTNYSIGNDITKNVITNIRIMPFPYSFFQSIKMNGDNVNQSTQESFEIEIIKHAPYLYSATALLPIPSNSILVLDQAYEKNWKAYMVNRETAGIKRFFTTSFPFIFGAELKEHVLVNNWANGWSLRQETNSGLISDQSQTILIVFLPQYLEFAGFGILIAVFAGILLYRKPS